MLLKVGSLYARDVRNRPFYAKLQNLPPEPFYRLIIPKIAIPVKIYLMNKNGYNSPKNYYNRFYIEENYFFAI